MRRPFDHINYSPDEQSGRGVLPEKVSVDGVNVPFDDLVNTFKNKASFEQANHERATQNKEERAAITAERQAATAERKAAMAAMERQQGQFTESLNRFAPGQEPVQEFDPYAAIANVDLLRPTAPEELAGALSQGLQATEQRMEQSFQQRMKAVEANSSKAVADAVSNFSKKDARKDAKATAERLNDETFDRHMKDKYADVVDALSTTEMSQVKEAYRTQFTKKSGGWQGQEWVFNSKAVDTAVRSAEPSFKVLLSRQAAEVRKETLLGRQAGDEATEATPLRGRQTASLSEGEVNRQADEINSALRKQTLHPLDVDNSLPDDPEALRRLIASRREAVEQRT